jgi:hypothetical protein
MQRWLETVVEGWLGGRMVRDCWEGGWGVVQGCVQRLLAVVDARGVCVERRHAA